VSAEPRNRRFRADDSGAGAVEFAIVLPVFLAFIFGLFQFGWAQHCTSSLRYALENAARVMMLNPTMTEAQVRGVVLAKLQGISDTNVTVTMTVATQASGTKLATLTGGYSYQIGVPGMASYPIAYSTVVQTPLP
jgi:Flp pilus assembly protein TadG